MSFMGEALGRGCNPFRVDLTTGVGGDGSASEETLSGVAAGV